MKFTYSVLLTLGLVSGHAAMADTELEMVAKNTSRARFFNDFDAKIESLENYTVTFIEHDNQILVREPARQATGSDDELNLTLIKAKHKL